MIFLIFSNFFLVSFESLYFILNFFVITNSGYFAPMQSTTTDVNFVHLTILYL